MMAHFGGCENVCNISGSSLAAVAASDDKEIRTQKFGRENSTPTDTVCGLVGLGYFFSRYCIE
jgi:hypothetical protein